MAPSPKTLGELYGVKLIGRVSDVSEDNIVCRDSYSLSCENLTIVWCTGFSANYDYICARRPEEVFRDSAPLESRGVVAGAPGLYFLGLKFQYTFGSHLMYGVGRDANHIAQHIDDYLHQTVTISSNL